MTGVLEGVKVVDLSSIWAGPGAMMYLADQGADVVKVEPFGGENGRRTLATADLQDNGPPFLALNRNKRGIVVDIKRPQGKEVVLRLARWADVFFHNFRPGVSERLGLGYEDLESMNPRLIYAAIDPFGKRGPYADRPGYDVIFQCLGGSMHRRMPDGTPINAGVWVADASTPMLMAYGIALALYHRERTGKGQRVEVTLLHATLAMQNMDLVRVEKEQSQRPANIGPGNSPYKGKDGQWFFIAVMYDREWARLCKALGLEHLIDDPNYKTLLARYENSEPLYYILENIFATKTRDEWLEVLTRGDVPCAPILERSEVLSSPQVTANDMAVTQQHPLAGKVTMVNTPVRLSAAPGSVRTPAPLLGQHTDEVLRELGYTASEVSRLREQKAVG